MHSRISKDRVAAMFPSRYDVARRAGLGCPHRALRPYNRQTPPPRTGGRANDSCKMVQELIVSGVQWQEYCAVIDKFSA